MGRPGTGGGRPGGSGHSSGGGGHRPSRSSSSSFSTGRRSSMSPRSDIGRTGPRYHEPYRHVPPPPPPRHRFHGYGRRYGSYRNYGTGHARPAVGCFSVLKSLGCIAILLAVVFAVVKIGGSCASRAPSNRNDAGYSESVSDGAYNQENGKVTVARNSPTQAFNPDCVIDNDNWFDGDEKRAGQDYEFFYDKLGIQPYIVINGYIDSVGTDAARTSYAVDWYNENLHDSDTLLVMYFAEPNPNDVGYFAYAYGDNVRIQLEAIEPLLDAGLDAHYFDGAPSAEMFRRVLQYVTDRVTVS